MKKRDIRGWDAKNFQNAGNPRGRSFQWRVEQPKASLCLKSRQIKINSGCERKPTDSGMRSQDRLLRLLVIPLCTSALVTSTRIRRQTSLLCLGDNFITTLVNGVLDANRDTLRRNEPNPLGTCQEYGIFKICNGRARGLYGLRFPSGISAVCDDTGDYVRFKTTMTVQDFFFDFDINYPLSYGGGTLTAAWQFFAADITAYWPLRKAETGEAPKITEMSITVQRQPYVKITGFYPVSIAFRIFFEGSVRIFPQFSHSFLSYLLKQVLQQWIDGYHTQLPF